MQDQRHFILCPFGTGGDVFPLLHLGRALLRHGHRVTMVAMDYFADAAARAGLDVVTFGDREEFDAFGADPDIWKPLKGTQLVFKAAAQVTARVHESIRRAIGGQSEHCVLVSPATNFGARLARETEQVPLVTVHLQPISMLSAHDWPLLHLRLAWTRRLPLWLRKRLMAMPTPIDWMMRRTVGPLCKAHSVRVPRRLARDWWHSPDANLVLFPAAFAAPQPDWPVNSFQAGFPLEDLATEQRHLPPEMETFLRSGEAPILFTAGTGNRHAKAFFATSLEACHALGLRAIFATRHLPDLPDALPTSCLGVEYVPFSQVLPHCAVLAHHGGIGTLSQAIAAGIPQLIMPLAHDQPDNALRVRAHGLGESLPPGKWQVMHLCQMLDELLNNDERKRRCKEAAAQVQRVNQEEVAHWLACVRWTGTGV